MRKFNDCALVHTNNDSQCCKCNCQIIIVNMSANNKKKSPAPELRDFAPCRS